MLSYKQLAESSILNRGNLDAVYQRLLVQADQDLADDLHAMRLGLKLSNERVFRLAFYLHHVGAVGNG